ncbi:MAG TPA: ABC transporter ATP-binding protein [Bacillota bacterium]|jgi:acetoin utilization transport system ATP-binding protein|nr:ABC transporter ATP-binding protein [Bacillota bacterium]HOB86303.1 ABC transporter ATP-binding protein [Bacillota bacterium]HOP69616.1 ABC transporter ATP-binding protein [Bacillota bacterium]HPT34693.1 ABC transporter ATP-binding protein [Bacillota bacterium]HPZ65666.1 ABC transporter ATP-binding protein [Bacillota bacterium]
MIRIKGLSHTYRIGKRGRIIEVPVLHEIDLHVARKEIVAVTGRSGSGKSTLLNLISGFIRPSAGEIEIDGCPVTRFSEGEWADFRLQKIGFIFQNYQLIPGMTVYENVELPMVLRKVEPKQRRRLAEEMLERVGLAEFAAFYGDELSGGMQQRVSVARSLVLRPPLILADEPTGSLDSENERALLDFILQLNRELQVTFLIVTHDRRVASIAGRRIHLQDGRLVGEGAAV